MKNKPRKIVWGKGADMNAWAAMRSEMEGINDDEIVRIGASDVSVITGSNPWKSKQRLFYHLINYHHSFFITETTLAGHLNEPTTIKRYEAYVHNDEQESLNNSLNGVSVRKASKANYFLVNDAYPNSFVSLDYTTKGVTYSPITGELYPKNMPIELKHTNKQYYIKWTNGCARQYMEQIQYQMLIANVDKALLLVMIDGVNFKIKEIDADPEMQKEILRQVNEFAEKVKVGKMALKGMKEAEAEGDIETAQAFYAILESVTPEPVGTEDNLELMQEIYAEPIDSDVNIKVADENDDFNMAQYLKCIKLANKIEEYKTLCRVKLLESCGSFEGIKGTTNSMTNRRATQFKKAYFQIK